LADFGRLNGVRVDHGRRRLVQDSNEQKRTRSFGTLGGPHKRRIQCPRQLSDSASPDHVVLY